MLRLSTLIVALGCLLTLSGDVWAQRLTTDSSSARLIAGPLALDPRLAIRQVGMDTNVFNDSDTPTRDFTATVGPELDSWLRVGRLIVSGESSVTWTYFRKSASQRSFDVSQAGQAALDLRWGLPYLTVSVERTRQRPNLEIDARARRETFERAGGIDLRLGPTVSVDVTHAERRYDFAVGGEGNAALADALNRRERETTAVGRIALTPLTTFAVRAGARRDRFERSSFRDSNSFIVMPGVEFKPLALIAGTAYVGFRQFDPIAADVPAFRGMVADVGLSYLLRDLTRLTVDAERDVDYSFEAGQPYYVSNGARLSIVQALGASWDVAAHIGRTTLAYRTRGNAPDESVANRADRFVVYGVGIGRRLGTEVRIGVDIEYARRASTVAGRAYDGIRGGGSLTYGF